MAQLFTNNAAATLASGITSGATTLTLASGKGALFPSPTGSDYFLLTLTQAAVESSWEIVKCTARSTDTLTIVRAQEGTTAAAWSTGDKVEIRYTAGAVVSAESATTLLNKTFTGYTETVYALSGTVINPANGTMQTCTLTGNTTFTKTMSDGQCLTLFLNPSTFTPTFPAVTWVSSSGNSAPTLAASVYNVIVLFQIAGTLYANYQGHI
jgi:hypothetical protein